MDCGIPYCHTGCPVNNQIPDWNDLVYHGDWKTAAHNLHSTNNFPEVTGRVCPAPCEASCTLNIDDNAGHHQDHRVRHRRPRASRKAGSRREPPEKKTGKKIAIVGSGPAGLAAAQQLARAGHDVHVYEKNAKPGGLLRYGIPDFKMEKDIIDRAREADGGRGRHLPLQRRTSARRSRPRSSKPSTTRVLLAGGSEQPFDFFAKSPGRDLDGIHYAMDFLPQQNRRVAGETPPASPTPRRSRPRTSTSSSSAAATRASTASAPRSGRAPSR